MNIHNLQQKCNVEGKMVLSNHFRSKYEENKNTFCLTTHIKYYFSFFFYQKREKSGKKQFYFLKMLNSEIGIVLHIAEGIRLHLIFTHLLICILFTLSTSNGTQFPK